MELFIFRLGNSSLFNVVLVISRRVFAQWCPVQSVLDNLTRQRENDRLQKHLVKLLRSGQIICFNLPCPMPLSAKLPLCARVDKTEARKIFNDSYSVVSVPSSCADEDLSTSGFGPAARVFKLLRVDGLLVRR